MLRQPWTGPDSDCVRGRFSRLGVSRVHVTFPVETCWENILGCRCEHETRSENDPPSLSVHASDQGLASQEQDLGSRTDSGFRGDVEAEPSIPLLKPVPLGLD